MSRRNDRDFRILAAVVRLYSGSGQPISSALVARYLEGAVSSATVRADMNRLEGEGLLAKPHTSAGRVPTDAGFRLFVNELLTAEAGPEIELGADLPVVRRELTRNVGSSAMVKALAGLLSRLTENIGIILGPSWDEVRAQRIELHLKESRRVLMVLVFDNALVRTGTFAVDEDFTVEVLDEAARLLSERIAGRTVREIREGALADLGGGERTAEHCARELAAAGSDLFTDMEEGELELMGVTNVLDEPEFSEPDRLKNLVRFLESPRAIRSALRRLSPENEDGIAVWIGSENPIDALQTFSLVSAPYAVGDRRGVLAVLGLRRMSYDRAIGGMQMLARTLKHLN